MSTTTISNVERAIQFFNALDERNIDFAKKCWADDHQMHFPSGAPGLNKEVHEGFTRAFLEAFPDIEHVVEDIIESGQKVILRGYFTGTHQGNFNGIPPTNKKVKASWIDIMEFNSQGQVQNEWVEVDMVGVMQQLGVVPVNN